MKIVKISKQELSELTEDAEAAFWQVVVNRFPAATTGDLAIDLVLDLGRLHEEAIALWIEENVPSV